MKGIAEAFAGGAFEIFADRRMSYGDKGACALHQGLAPEFSHSVLCDYVLDHMTGRHYAGAFREHRLYQADWLLRFYGFEAEEILDEKHCDFDLCDY